MDYFGNDTYLAQVVYTCGKYAHFTWSDPDTGSTIIAGNVTTTCQWNKTWDMEALPGCECESH